MAGGLIISGDIDEVPEIRAARDIPLVIQDIGLFPGPTDARSLELRLRTERHLADLHRQRDEVQPGDQTAGTDHPQERVHHRRLSAALLSAERRAVLSGSAQPGQARVSPTGTQLTPAQIPMAPGEVGTVPHVECLLGQHDADRGGRPRDAPAGARWRELPGGEGAPGVPVQHRRQGKCGCPLRIARSSSSRRSRRRAPTASMQLAQTEQFLASDAKVIAEIVVARSGQGHGPADETAGAEALLPGRSESTDRERPQHPVFRHVSAGRESVRRHRLHHQQQLLRRSRGAAGDGVEQHGNLEPGDLRPAPWRNRRPSIPHPRQSLRAADVDRQDRSGESEGDELPAGHVSRHHLGSGEERGDRPHALQAMDRQDGVPLPHPAARGYGHDAELPDRVERPPAPA